HKMLNINNLSISIGKRIINSVSFNIASGAKFGLIGESGSGKSLTALAIMRLLPYNAFYSAASSINLNGTELLELSERDMRYVRGSKIGMIFQDPMMCLNPVLTIKAQLIEVMQGQ